MDLESPTSSAAESLRLPLIPAGIPLSWIPNPFLVPGDVVPWLRSVRFGRVELYLLSHDPTERVDLSAERPDIVALLLPRMEKLLHEVATEGPDTPGWTQRAAPCPRFIRSLNITEVCCQARRASRHAHVDEKAQIAARPQGDVVEEPVTLL